MAHGAAGLGYGLSEGEVKRLLALRAPFELMVVCGRNRKQRSHMERLKREWGAKNLHVYGFVDNVQQMMDGADMLVSKPGGLYARAKPWPSSCPWWWSTPLQGTKSGISEFLLNCGAAVSVTKTFPLDEAVHFLLETPGRLQHMRRAMEKVAKPDALGKTSVNI